MPYHSSSSCGSDSHQLGGDLFQPRVRKPTLKCQLVSVCYRRREALSHDLPPLVGCRQCDAVDGLAELMHRYHTSSASSELAQQRTQLIQPCLALHPTA